MLGTVRFAISGLLLALPAVAQTDASSLQRPVPGTVGAQKVGALKVVQWAPDTSALVSVNTEAGDAATLHCNRDASGNPTELTGVTLFSPQLGAAEALFDSSGYLTRLDLIGALRVSFDYGQQAAGLVTVVLYEPGAAFANEYLVDVIAGQVLESNVIPPPPGMLLVQASTHPQGTLRVRCQGGDIGPPVVTPSGKLILTNVIQIEPDFPIPLSDWTWDPQSASWTYRAPILQQAPFNCDDSNAVLGSLCPSLGASPLPLEALLPICALLDPLATRCAALLPLLHRTYRILCTLATPGCGLVEPVLAQFSDTYTIAVTAASGELPEGFGFQLGWNPLVHGPPSPMVIDLPIPPGGSCQLGDIVQTSSPSEPPAHDASYVVGVETWVSSGLSALPSLVMHVFRDGSYKQSAHEDAIPVGQTVTFLEVTPGALGTGDQIHVSLVSAAGVTLDQASLAVPLDPPNVMPGMVPIPSGTFLMGSDAPSGPPYYGSDETRPVHQVTISQPFWMSRFQVTQAEFQALMGSNPSLLLGPNRPVDYVSWNHAMAYCAALNAQQTAAGQVPPGYQYRLPTEAEWEYACRAGTTTEFHYGPSLFCEQAQFGYSNHSDSSCSTSGTAPVGSYEPNAWGLYDMHGNVWEWCLDGFHHYTSSPKTDPYVAGGPYPVVRGGSFVRGSRHVRSAHRDFGDIIITAYDNVGFRVVLAPALVP